MKTNQIIQLLGVVLILGALLFFLETGEEQKFQHQEKVLLEDVDGNAAVRVVVEAAGQKSAVLRTDNGWTVPDRFGYPAAPEKVNSLLIKAFGLSSTQQLPTKADKFAALGVADDNFKGKISFWNAENGKEPGKEPGKELGAILLGENRKERKVPGSFGSSVGQYVRRAGTDAVYLISEPFTLSTTPDAWLEKAILNVSQTKIRQVVWNGESNGELKLVRAKVDDPTSTLQLEPGFTNGEELEESLVTQVAGALENLTLNDVLKNDAQNEQVKALNFDKTYTAETSSGVIYTVSTAINDTKGYLKIDLRYSEELAKTITDEFAAKNIERKKQFDEEQAKKKEASKEAAQKEEAPEAKFEELKPELMTKEQAEALKQKLAPWIYEVAKFQVEKFRKPRAEFVKKKDAPKKDSEESAGETADVSASDMTDEQAGE